MIETLQHIIFWTVVIIFGLAIIGAVWPTIQAFGQWFNILK